MRSREQGGAASGWREGRPGGSSGQGDWQRRQKRHPIPLPTQVSLVLHQLNNTGFLGSAPAKSQNDSSWEWGMSHHRHMLRLEPKSSLGGPRFKTQLESRPIATCPSLVMSKIYQNPIVVSSMFIYLSIYLLITCHTKGHLNKMP